jgi:protein involved in polysaccharide export with SLBB domain
MAPRPGLAADRDLPADAAAEASPRAMENLKAENAELALKLDERQRRAREVQALKAKACGPRRFAEDLFDTREDMATATEGGISEDYVLGVGDQLRVVGFDSATFELPASVDGRGEVIVPRIGTVKVSGLTLAAAKAAIQAKVARQLGNTTVDVSVVKLRQVRVFVMGEVYRPGSYLVPSLSSLVNVLGLAGGPTRLGSYRRIRVLRGGKMAGQMDLYPLRASGAGNLNFSFQSGDTVFVPLLCNPVLLEGSFLRVADRDADLDPRQDRLGDTRLQDRGGTRFPRGPARPRPDPGPRADWARDRDRGREARDQDLDLDLDGTAGLGQDRTQAPEGNTGWDADRAARPEDPGPGWAPDRNAARDRGLDPRWNPDRDDGDRGLGPDWNPDAARDPDREPGRGQGRDAGPEGRGRELARDREARTARADRRDPACRPEPRPADRMPPLPAMQFELLPGETALDALGFAGGLLPKAYADGLTLRRQDAAGATSVSDLAMDRLGSYELKRGDVLSALPRRAGLESLVTVAGWVRVPGSFARTEGLRVGDLLQHPAQIMPDTYLRRGEIIRTLDDGSTRYLSFDVARAMAGEPGDNLELRDRDRVELHRLARMRLPEQVTLSGPFTRAGVYRFHPGMRVADLVFEAGIPEKRANRMAAELARTRDDGPSTVRQLDLARLISTEAASPVNLADDALNPLLRPDDEVTVYEKPEFRIHRAVRIDGQVAKPGLYVLDTAHPTLSQLVARAGGLAPDAMPQAGIFFRNPLPETLAAGSMHGRDISGISEILDRLNETKYTDAKPGSPEPYSLLKVPVLHGLGKERLNRVVVDFPAALAGNAEADLELLDRDEIIIPRRTDTVMVIGETATPFAFYRVKPGMSVGSLLKLAGGTTRNADTWNIRLLKADGRIQDTWVNHRAVEPGDAVLVPQVVRRATNWQDNLNALMPLAVLLNAVRK